MGFLGTVDESNNSVPFFPFNNGDSSKGFSFGTTERGGYKWAVNNAQELQSTPYHATFLGGLKNLVTGDLDFAREVELLNQTQAFNAQEAAKSRDWQQEMSNTAHQREAADLEAIGLNPALTLGSGGANSFTAATASSGVPGHQASGRGFPAMLQLLMGLISLGVNNARKVDALGQTLDMADKKLNAQIFQNDARLDAMSEHWKTQDAVAKMKLASYDWMNADKSEMYRQYLDNLIRFKKGWR